MSNPYNLRKELLRVLNGCPMEFVKIKTSVVREYGRNNGNQVRDALTVVCEEYMRDCSQDAVQQLVAVQHCIDHLKGIFEPEFSKWERKCREDARGVSMPLSLCFEEFVKSAANLPQNTLIAAEPLRCSASLSATGGMTEAERHDGEGCGKRKRKRPCVPSPLEGGGQCSNERGATGSCSGLISDVKFTSIPGPLSDRFASAVACAGAVP